MRHTHTGTYDQLKKMTLAFQAWDMKVNKVNRVICYQVIDGDYIHQVDHSAFDSIHVWVHARDSVKFLTDFPNAILMSAL